ncbi:hypothetical protein DICVIV_03528 [Dictyocaulus viviparus]|uniref:Uncharacterized protein n=1 Tax=Dictyocaulus viviparus TaxID=29172 RepID=A0A0D8Y2U2_DICVI|nr:hypothetical protein DICVIV_03528 [Dictyocaulus viviparus]
MSTRNMCKACALRRLRQKNMLIVTEVEVYYDKCDHPKRIREDFVEVDVDAIDIPPGRWRVVTSHVPERRFMIVKFASNQEISDARKLISISEDDSNRKRKKEIDNQGFTYLWSSKEKVRPGLNVFDEKGNELEWDYEHDTRFFDDPHISPKKDDSKPSNAATSGAPQAKIVKGRGMKKGSILYSGGGNTLASDELDLTEIKRRRIAARLAEADNIDQEQEEDMWDERASSPTPQPWDRPKGRLANRLTRE